jgi:hypothetical protein
VNRRGRHQADQLATKISQPERRLHPTVRQSGDVLRLVRGGPRFSASFFWRDSAA